MGKYAFTVEWINGSINDNVIKYLKANNIEFHYNCYFQLVFDICGLGIFYTYDYEKISKNIFGIILKEAIS